MSDEMSTPLDISDETRDGQAPTHQGHVLVTAPRTAPWRGAALSVLWWLEAEVEDEAG